MPGEMAAKPGPWATAVSSRPPSCQVSAPRVVQVKREIAEKARGYWGSTVLADAGVKPTWRREWERRWVA